MRAVKTMDSKRCHFSDQGQAICWIWVMVWREKPLNATLHSKSSQFFSSRVKGGGGDGMVDFLVGFTSVNGREVHMAPHTQNEGSQFDRRASWENM